MIQTPLLLYNVILQFKYERLIKMTNIYPVSPPSLQELLDVYNELMKEKDELENKMQDLSIAISNMLEDPQQFDEEIEEFVDLPVKIINIYL